MRTSGGKALRNAVKQASRVLPVVKTSSTSNMCRIPSWEPGITENEPATLPAFSVMLRRICVLVYLWRFKISVLTGVSSAFEIPFAMTSA